MYFDDILVYIRDEVSHVEYLSQVFQVFRQQSYMSSLRSVNFSLLKLSFLVMLCLVREFKLMNLWLRLSRVDLPPHLSHKFEDPMG